MIFSRRNLLLGLLALAALYIARLGVAPLADPDEGRYAEIAREMNASGDFAAPHLNGVPYFEKPPLVLWLVAGSLKLFGANEFAVRLPIALLSLGSVLAIYFLLRREHPEAAVIAALAQGLNLYSFVLSQILTLDPGLTFFMTVAGLLLYRAVRDESAGKPFLTQLRLAYLACAMAVLTKGLIGLLPGIGFGLYLILSGRLRKWARFRPWEVFILTTLVNLPWVMTVERRFPGFARDAIWEQQFVRFVSGPADHHRTSLAETAGLFIGLALLGLFPWVIQLIAGLRAGWKERTNGGLAAFALCQWLVISLFFLLSSTKLATYLLPAWPWAAVMIGLAFAPRERVIGLRKATALRGAVFIGLVLALFVLIALPFYTETRSARRQARIINADPRFAQMELYFFGDDFPSGLFYLGRTVTLVRYGLHGELREGAKYTDHFPEVFQNDFLARFNRETPMAALVHPYDWRGLTGKLRDDKDWPPNPYIFSPFQLIDEQGEAVLIINHWPGGKSDPLEHPKNAAP